MLIYAFVALVIVICLILYKFFAVVETLVDEHSNKKESFSNFEEINNDVNNLIKKGVQHLHHNQNHSSKNYQQIIQI